MVKTGVNYFYDPESRIAYSYYGDEALLEGYGMTEWLRSLPEEPVAMETFCRDYSYPYPPPGYSPCLRGRVEHRFGSGVQLLP